MARGLKLHLKRLAAPKTWMLQKLGGTWAPRPSTGPHKLRECMPLVVLLRNRLKYALNRKEVQDIVYSRLVKVDGKTRTDTNYPVGFMDVVSLDKVNQHFRILYDHKGRFAVQRISAEEAAYKICRVRRVQLGAKSVPYLATHDARTIRFPDPDIKVNDSVLVDIATGKIRDFARFEVGNVAMVTGGRSMGRVGLIHRVELHEGTHQICHLRDANGQDFATRLGNVFVIGRGDKPWVTLPSHKGLLVSVVKEYEQRHSVVLHA